MNVRRMIFAAVVLMSILLSACAPRAAVQPTAEAGGLAALIEALQSAGAQVTQGEVLEDSVFSVPGRQITVNGLPVTVYEFADAATREQAASAITGAGYIIGQMAIDWIDTPHFFSKDRLIVLYVGKDQALVDLLSGSLGAELQTQGEEGREMAPYIMAAIDALGVQLGIAASEIHYVTAEEMEWTDGCLGLGGPAESCLQALVPGHRVVLEAGGVEYEVRTDETGEVVRVKP